jgi:hypothetical protein
MTAFGCISGFGIIPQPGLSSVQALLLFSSTLQPFLKPIHNANAKRTPIGEIPPKAFSLQIVGNLAVLARSALDPWLCAAIFR